MSTKKKILFVIHRLEVGGAEKSFVSLLNALPLEQFDVYVKAQKPNGMFRKYVPECADVSELPNDYICMAERITGRNFWRHVTLRTLLLKVMCIICCTFRGKDSKRRMNREQYYNEFWKKHFRDVPGHYDVVVSYMDCVNHYVIDHVDADRKILWCHNDYNKLDYVADYDRPYYGKAYRICTISEICRQSLVENFPEYKDKFEVVENISSSRMIESQAEMLDEINAADDGFLEDSRFKIVSLGRLTEQKGFDYAVDAAKIMKERGLSFCWYILGIGYSENDLKNQARRNDVTDVIKFVGVRANPYPYIKRADLFVIPSRFEGKSIALDEAKILCKPIVATKYPSVSDALEDGKNGVLVNMDARSIADGIQALYVDEAKRNALREYLKNDNCSNEEEVVNKFMSLV